MDIKLEGGGEGLAWPLGEELFFAAYPSGRSILNKFFTCIYVFETSKG